MENNDIITFMARHGMKLPSDRGSIRISGAKTILENCFKYFLSMQGKALVWLPEYDRVAGWLEDTRGRGLLLYGDCGRGKSYLATYVIPAIFLKYLNKVIKCYDALEMNENIDLLTGAKSYMYFSLDDIGTESVVNTYGNKRDAFAEIIDSAEKYGKVPIISTNLSGDGIIERYGERVMERLISTTARIEFKGKSLRK